MRILENLESDYFGKLESRLSIIRNINNQVLFISPEDRPLFEDMTDADCEGMFKNMFTAPAGVPHLTECRTGNQRVTGSFFSWGTCLGYRPAPQQGAHKRQPHIDVSLPLFSLLSLL